MILPGKVQLDSRALGWRHLHLLRVEDPNETDPFDVYSPDAQTIVLVKHAAENKGGPNIESRRGTGWVGARYRAGDVGMTAAGRGATLRWRNSSPHTTLHLRLSAHLLEQAARETSRTLSHDDLDRLSLHDPILQTMILAMETAVERGATRFYADAAAHFIAAHLIDGAPPVTRVSAAAKQSSVTLRRMDDVLRARLADQFALTELADYVGLGVFQLIRLCKLHHGEAPFQRLQRFRIERSRQLLQQRRLSITDIAFECGYSSPSAFGAAFRRATGMTPRAYRDL
ncbi:helix-turn-helix domain-containing protein [Sphingomonas sp.]|uniref:helix-turn-helix domain-containing protein n=1 Tax=Sphingomonas sp. TaxID=28214 RepID=UPI003B3B3B01